MRDIEKLVDQFLSGTWTNLRENRKSIEGGKYPGVYALAFSHRALEGRRIDPEQIYYVGMSVSQAGVKGRLGQFLRTIEGKTGHSGGKTFYENVMELKPFAEYTGRKKFWVSTLTLQCEVRKTLRQPKDLRIMGKVTCLEKFLIARIRELTDDEPNLNKA